MSTCASVCTVQLRYEQQISELKQQLETGQPAAGTEAGMSHVQTLQEELQRVKETHQEKEKSLQDQIESLQQQLKHKVGTGALLLFIQSILPTDHRFVRRPNRVQVDTSAKPRWHFAAG